MAKSSRSKSSQADKYFLNLAGEFAVASELNRRKMLATVSYGNSKSADIFVIAPDTSRVVCVEVKTTARKRWVVGDRASQAQASVRELVWVLVLLPQDNASMAAPQFFVLSQEDIKRKTDSRNREYNQKYMARHGKNFIGRGVDNLELKDVQEFEGKWEKVANALTSSREA